MSRDDFSDNVRRMVGERVGYLCSKPDCGMRTVAAKSGSSGRSTIGVAAHIRAAAKGGPRYDSSQSAENRKSLSNAIWLCSNHDALIDSDPESYSVELLRTWKNEAEARSRLEIGSSDGQSQGRSVSVAGSGPAIIGDPSGDVAGHNIVKDNIFTGPINLSNPQPSIEYTDSGLTGTAIHPRLTIVVSILRAGFSNAKNLKVRDSDPDALWLWAEVELDSNQRNTYIEWVTAKIAGKYVRASGFVARTLWEKTDEELYFFKAPDTVTEGDHPIKVTAYSDQEFISDEYIAVVRTEENTGETVATADGKSTEYPLAPAILEVDLDLSEPLSFYLMRDGKMRVDLDNAETGDEWVGEIVIDVLANSPTVIDDVKVILDETPQLAYYLRFGNKRWADVDESFRRLKRGERETWRLPFNMPMISPGNYPIRVEILASGHLWPSSSGVVTIPRPPAIPPTTGGIGVSASIETFVDRVSTSPKVSEAQFTTEGRVDRLIRVTPGRKIQALRFISGDGQTVREANLPCEVACGDAQLTVKAFKDGGFLIDENGVSGVAMNVEVYFDETTRPITPKTSHEE